MTAAHPDGQYLLCKAILNRVEEEGFDLGGKKEFLLRWFEKGKPADPHRRVLETIKPKKTLPVPIGFRKDPAAVSQVMIYVSPEGRLLNDPGVFISALDPDYKSTSRRIPVAGFIQRVELQPALRMPRSVMEPL
jgi:hypothetical protein